MMKWISLPAAALLVCGASLAPAWAVDTTGQNNNNNPSYNPYGLPGGYGALPGQPLLMPNANPSADQFLNTNPYLNFPVYPGGAGNPNLGGNPPGTIPAVTPGIGGTLPLPNPNPNINPSVPSPGPIANPQPNGRDRVNPNPSLQYAPPMGGTSQPKWRLGVYSKDEDYGVVIHQVVPQSAAAKAGLEVNDVIVAVNGYQVGYVNGQLFDLATEFERLANNQGMVRLLVLNNRAYGTQPGANQQQRLVNVPVTLESRLTAIRGTIAWERGQQLPANAIMNIELKELIGSGNNAVTFESRQYQNINSHPMPFQIDFDPARISQNGQYLVTASIHANGREIYRSSQPQRVLEQGGQNRQVALQLNPIQQTQNPYQPTVPVVDSESQVAQIVYLFQQYLGRPPKDKELAAYLDVLQKGYTMPMIQRDLLAHQQFWNRCDADKQTYIVKLHELLVKRQPTPQEMNYWLAQYDARNGIRLELAKDFQEALGIY